jgi:hypothetical protein
MAQFDKTFFARTATDDGPLQVIDMHDILRRHATGGVVMLDCLRLAYPSPCPLTVQ